jgi:excisionase family DNA binding protein
MIPTLDISPDHDKLPRLLTVQEVSQILHLGRSTVYLLIQLGDLPCVRFRRSVRVRPGDLEKFIESKLANTGNQ